jgi:LmbE family N-acetylglucosaminyl deacetylase
VQFANPGAEIWVPDGTAPGPALARTTHLAIAAHQDDVEILAFSAVLECFQSSDLWLTAAIITNGAGSSRAGAYASFTDAQMREVRRLEQRKAAQVGNYAAAVQLDYESARVKTADPDLARDLAALLRATRPQVLFTHNLADRHDTHVGTALRVIEACRALPEAERPARVLGGEVWRDLDWLADPDKVILDVQGRDGLAAALLGVFDSQVSGGKRYDLAALGRRRAHATFHESHDTDASTALSFAMDLTPLVKDPTLDPASYALACVARFADDVRARLDRLR